MNCVKINIACMVLYALRLGLISLSGKRIDDVIYIYLKLFIIVQMVSFSEPLHPSQDCAVLLHASTDIFKAFSLGSEYYTVPLLTIH